MTTLLKDLRYGLRMLLRSPLFTGFAVLSLALGIGANAAIFTFVKAVFFNSLPITEPERVVTAFSTHPSTPDLLPVSYLNFVDYREMNDVFSDLSAVRPISVRLETGDEPERVIGEIVTGNYFDVLGVEAFRGRTFLPEEDRTPGSHPVVVVSHGLWQRRFGGDPDFVGKNVKLNGLDFTVVGIAPEGFTGFNVLDRHELWVPMMMYEHMLFGVFREWVEVRDAVIFFAFGRLADGVEVRRAETAMQAIAARLEQEYPENEGLSLRLVPLLQSTIDPNARGNFVLVGAVLMTSVGLLLFIACFNVANLLVARALARRGEIAVRFFLGAGLGRMIRQLLTEGIVLALLGSAGGLLVGIWIRNLLWAFKPPLLPDFLDVGLDGQVLAFALGLTLVVGVIFGLTPALHLSSRRLVSALRQQHADTTPRVGRFGLRHALVVLQVALSFVALVAAGLFVGSLRQARQVDVGFDADRLLAVSYDLGTLGYDEGRGTTFYRQVVEQVTTAPGVESAALARGLMFSRGLIRTEVTFEGRDPDPEGDDGVPIQMNLVGPGYFKTTGIARLEGRDFSGADDGGTRRVAVVNALLAERFWPGQSAVGQRFRWGGGGDEPVEVVGVVETSKYTALDEPPIPFIYLPLAQNFSPTVFLHVRAAGDPSALAETVQREVRTLDGNLIPEEVQEVSKILDRALWAPRTAAALLAIFGLLAFVLAMIGVYSLMAYLVNQRRREIGIRMALGARRDEILKLVVMQGMTTILIGVGTGLAVALILAPRAAGLLFGIEPTEPAILAGITLVLLVFAVLANYVPARRATRLNPVTVLRNE